MATLQEMENLWAKVCFDPEYQPEGRYQLYRELVTDRIFEVIQNITPVARNILSRKEWDILIWDFLKNAPPRSEILRELPFEFSQNLKRNSHPLQEKYPYLGELIEYEYLEIQVRFGREEETKPAPGTLHLNPSHALGRFEWPVHFIGERNCEAGSLPRGNYFLLLWRKQDTLEVKFMEVNPLVALLIHQLENGDRKAEDLLKAVAVENDIPLSSEFRNEGKGLIQRLISQGILTLG